MAKDLCQQINGKKGSTARNMLLKGNGNTDGFLAFGQPTALADLTSDVCAYAFQSTTPKYWNGTTWSSFPQGGGGSWDDLYASDKTLTINSTTLTFALTHATNAGLTLTTAAGSSGIALQITRGAAGTDIAGTAAAWSITSAGAGTFTTIVGCASVTAATNLALEANGAGTISIGATSTGAIDIGTGGGAITLVTAITASLGITITAGGLLSSDGIVDIVDNANDASTLRATNDTQSTYGNASDAGMVVFRSESLTTGALLHLSLDETNLAGGSYIRCWGQDAGAAVFTVAEYGVTTIAGPAAGGSAALTVTAGDVSIADGSITLTDADNAATLDITNDTATTIGAAADAGVIDIDSESLTTGALLNLSLDETALTTGWYLRCYGQDAAANVFSVGEYGATVITTAAAATSLTITSASTNVDVVSIATTALTTGDAVQITSTAETLAAGELLKINNTENGDLSATPKTGNLCSITSSVTMTTANTALDYDTLLITRSNISNEGGTTLTAAGSVLKLMNTSTNTLGTCTDTTKVLEIEQVEGGTAAPTGDVVKITSVGVGAQALNIVSASTTVSDVLITGSGVKADNKAYLQVGGNGATAAGGSMFRVASTGGTPAAATSYLVDFDYGSSTMDNNPVTMYLNAGVSTGAALYVLTAGVMTGGSVLIENTNAGALGSVLKFKHHSATPADNDVITRLTFAGMDDGGAGEAEVLFAGIDVTAIDISAGTEDAKMDFKIMVGGALTSQLYLQSSIAGATTLVAAAAAATLAGSAAGTAALTITNGDISLSAGKFISTTTADIYGLDVTVNRAAATQGVAVFTNSSATSAKSVLELEQADLDKPYIKFSGATTVTSATAGANGDVPAQIRSYIKFDLDGTEVLVPCYNT